MLPTLASLRNCVRLIVTFAACAIVAAATACAPADEGAAQRGATFERPAGALTRPGDPADSIADPEAALVASACLRGDPTHGEPWSIEHVADDSPLLALVPLQDLSPRDSARLAARISRAADALPADTTVADFRGLPVAVRDAWLLTPASDDTTVVAVVARRLPIESNPLEEHLTLFAVPDTLLPARRPLTVQWNARSAGAEEQLETRDPLVALRAPDGRLRVLLVRESPGRPLVESIGRDATGRWVLLWEGALASCP